jgi:very-short-patch-repair endonuclease
VLKHGDIKKRDAKEFRDAFSSFCSPRCECLNEMTRAKLRAKLKQTNIAKYGCACTLQAERCKAKAAKTMLARHGAEHAQQSKRVKQKTYATMLERYGVRCTT